MVTNAPVIRRVVLWRWRGEATPEQKLRAKEGLAYISFASPVAAVDFGEDLGLGGEANYSLALLRDHRDKASWDEYNRDPHHYRVGKFIDTLTHEAATARADYRYTGQASVRGRIRHLALYCWRDGIDARRTDEVCRALEALRETDDGVGAIHVVEDRGWARSGRADLAVEVHFADPEAARRFLSHPRYRKAAGMLADLTRPERSAEIQHRMLSG